MLNIYFDGGCYLSNPGAAAGAAVLISPTGERIIASKFLESATNNIAEYTGLIVGLEKALELDYRQVYVFGDSQLVVNQVNGIFRVNHSHLRVLRDQAVKLLLQFDSCIISWIPRERNAEADAAATAAINEALGLKPVSGAKLCERACAIATTLPVCSPAQELEAQIAQLKQQGSGAKFKVFLNLKVPGSRDKFTDMQHEALKQQLPVEVYAALDGAIGADVQLLSKAMRWYLRGLPVELAVRKVQVDAEVNANVSRKR